MAYGYQLIYPSNHFMSLNRDVPTVLSRQKEGTSVILYPFKKAFTTMDLRGKWTWWDSNPRPSDCQTKGLLTKRGPQPS
jgi:hypothetical protein